MHKYRVLLAACALACVMLVGCHQPIRDVQSASIKTTYCYAATAENMTGHVDRYVDGQTPNGWFERINPVIRRGHTTVNGLPYPHQHGFCIFEVPSFSSPGMVPVCTLFYYQRAHSGSADLDVVRSTYALWEGEDDDFYWSISNSTFHIAGDVAQANNGWHSVPLLSSGIQIVDSLGETGGGTLVTGWKYTGSTSGTYAEVDGATNDYPPYIKVVYDDEP